MESHWINGYVPADYLLWYPLSFSICHYPGGIHFACIKIWFNYQQFAIPMPFFRNEVNHLYFQLKSKRSKSQPLYSLAVITTMCYSNVTNLLHSLLVFAKEGILLEFYGVMHCKSGKHCYIYVTSFWLPEPRQRSGNKGRMIP
jgi:hypothetical protein